MSAHSKRKSIAINIKFNIRQAKPEDASDIADVHIKSWRQAYKGIIHQSYLDNGLDISGLTKHWQERLKQSRKGTFLAFNGPVINGFASIGKSRDDDYPDYAELYAIYLDPDYFGKGVGKALFQTCLEYAVTQGFKKLFVNVLTNNKMGRDFYERMGALPIENGEEELTIDGKPYLEMRYEWKSLKNSP